MKRDPSRKPNSSETRRLLALLIEARQDYADYLRAVANGQRLSDPAVKADLKSRCDETLLAWRTAHEAWQRDVFPVQRRFSPGGLN